MPSPIDAIIANAAEDIASHARWYLAGNMSPAQWAREMQVTLVQNWAASFKAGLGRVPTRAEEKWLRQEYNRHDRFVRQFQVDLPNLSESQVLNRAAMYADRLRGLYEAGNTAKYDIALPQVPGDGKTICRTNCRCHLEFAQEEGRAGNAAAVLVTWVYNNDEGLCDDCQRLGLTWNPLRVEV